MSGPARIDGTEVSLSGRGKVRLVATQPGDDKYDSAPQVEAEFDAKDPARLTRVLALAAGVIGTLLVLGGWMFWHSHSASPGSSVAQAPQKPPESIKPTPEPVKPVLVQKNDETAFAQSLSNAAVLVQQGNLEAARPVIEKLLQEHPQDAKALALKTQIDRNLEQAAKLKDVQQNMQLAQQAESEQKWAQAVQLLNQALLSASSLKDTNYAQSVSTELSYANSMVAANAALGQAKYPEAINWANAALAVKGKDPSASKLKADAQNGKEYQDALKAAQTALEKGNFGAAIAQADVASRLKPQESDPGNIKLLAQQEQAYQAASAAFQKGDYDTALSRVRLFQGTERFDLLSSQIGQEQSQLKAVQKAFNEGSYSDVLKSSLPNKPAFSNLKAAATQENQVLTQAQQKFATKDYSYVETLAAQTYSSKPPFAALLEDGRKALVALKNLQQSNAVPVTVATTVAATTPATSPATVTNLAGPTNTSASQPNPSVVTPAANPATIAAIALKDQLLQHWEILFSLRPRIPGNDDKPVRDPTKDSEYNLGEFDKAEAVYAASGALTPERKRRLN
ncbi:MAG TPA: hypothetical protein VGR76_18465, partial [Candidatus Angelobacter sp.]|nr:hypothetical protein [Candidatus Angelobacter sp.]